MDANANIGTQELSKHSVNLEPSKTMAVELDEGFREQAPRQRASSLVNPSLLHSYIFSQNDKILSILYIVISEIFSKQFSFFFFWCK